MTDGTNSQGGGLLAFLASTHFMIHVYTQLLPVLLLPLQEELGISLVQVSLLASIPRLVNVVIYLPAGLVADRHPTLMLTASFATTAVGALIIPFSRGFSPILLGFVLLSLGSTLYHPPSLKLASEFDPRRMSLAMGVHNAGASLGFAAGPLLLGAMMPSWGWRSTFYVWGPLTLLTAAVSYVYGRRRLEAADSGGEASDLRRDLKSILTLGFVAVVSMSVLAEAAFNVLFTFIPAYFTIERGMSYSLASIIAGLAPLTGLVGSFAGGFAGDRFGRYGMGVVVMLLIGGLVVTFPSLTTLWALAAAYGLYRCLQAAFMPLLNSMIAADSEPRYRSLSFSINFVAVNLVAAVVPTATSVFIEGRGTRIIFPIALVIIVPTVALIAVLGRRSRT